MIDRTAIDTIKGYFYQFDYTIASLLNLVDENNSIQIECVEDIDIVANEVTAVQCKYYAKTEYNHSVIKGPIMFMLDHFKEVKCGRKTKVNYLLYGHYKSGQSKLNNSIDINYLKTNFLTYIRKETVNGVKTNVTHYHHTELGLNDTDLEEFLSFLKINIRAKEFEEQFKEIIASLKDEFKCTEFSAEYFFYNNALRVIKEYSILPNPEDRNISKKVFIQRINTSSILFNEWFVFYKGKKKFFSDLRNQYFTSLNTSPFERFFLIDNPLDNYSRAEMEDLLLLISKKWCKTSKREPKPFCPYVYINNISEKELVEIKKDIYDNDFIIIDGFDFAGSSFAPNSIIKKADYSNQIKLKFVNTIDHLKMTINVIKKSRYIYQFYKTTPFFDIDNPAINHTKIQFQELKEIKEII